MERESLRESVGTVVLSRLAVVPAMAFSLLQPETLLGCPSCKDHLAANGLDTGYAVSILIMILVPLTIMATWTVLILRLRSFPDTEGGSEVDAA
jgi:hypothetical protein